jgi:hypothetical protein
MRSIALVRRARPRRRAPHLRPGPVIEIRREARWLAPPRARARRGGGLRAVLSRVPDGDGRYDDGHDDGRIEPLAGESGGGGCKDEEEQQRASQLPEEHLGSREPPVFPKDVRPVLPETCRCRGG